MSINSAKNYLYSGNIKKSYEEVIKVLKSDSFESEEAFDLFSQSILGNMNHLKKLHSTFGDWYKIFPLDKYSDFPDTKILNNIKISICASALINKDYPYFESLTKLKVSDADTDFKSYLSGFDQVHQNYGEQLYSFLSETTSHTKAISVWLVSDDLCEEKQIRLVERNEGIELLNDSKQIEASFQNSLSKAYLHYKKLSKNSKIGFAVAIENIDSSVTLEGSSASLAFFAAMYFSNKIPKEFENTAFMADLDLSDGTLVPVDPSGLKLKVEKAIETGYSQIVISPQNLHAVLEFQDKIKITSFKNLKELVSNKVLPINKLYLFSLIFIIILSVIIFFIYTNFNAKNTKIESNPIVENSLTIKTFLLNVEQLHIGQSAKPEIETEIIRQMKNNSWKKIPYISGFEIQDGDGIQINLSDIKTPLFVYILNLNSENKLSALFPWDDKMSKLNPLSSDKTIFPATFRLNKTNWTSDFYWINEINGNETIMIVTSDVRLDKLENLVSKAFNGEVVVSREEIVKIIK